MSDMESGPENKSYLRIATFSVLAYKGYSLNNYNPLENFKTFYIIFQMYEL